MVNRRARDISASTLRDFLEGAITNEEYEERYPSSKSDPALREIHLQVWFFYSDLKEHKLIGRNSLYGEQVRFFERCIRFLESDLEFEWQPQRIRPLHALFRFFGFSRETAPAGAVDTSVWRFHTQEQYQQSL